MYTDYSDLKRFAGVHDTQHLLLRIQEELSRTASAAMGMIAATKDPVKLSTAELTALKGLFSVRCLGQRRPERHEVNQQHPVDSRLHIHSDRPYA